MVSERDALKFGLEVNDIEPPASEGFYRCNECKAIFIQMMDLKKLTEDKFAYHVDDLYEIIFGVFVLSEKLQDITTKNAMMEAALATAGLIGIDGSTRGPSYDVVNAVYNSTPVGSPARRLVTDMWTELSIEFIFSCFRYLHQGFVEDLGKSLQNARKPAENILVRKGVAAYQEEMKEG
jgi:hypothetical protein